MKDKLYESKQCEYYNSCATQFDYSGSMHNQEFCCDPSKCSNFILKEEFKNEDKNIQTK